MQKQQNKRTLTAVRLLSREFIFILTEKLLMSRD